MDKLKVIILVVIYTIAPLFSYSQDTKIEIEKSISGNDMPEKSIELLQPILAESQKVKFYQETGGSEISFEAKLIWEGDLLSIEFLKDGSLMDIEQLINIKDVDRRIQQRISRYFAENFRKHKITRMQRQFTAEDNEDSDSEVIEEFMEHDWEDLTIRYEIVAEVINEEILGPYEFLFDDKGDILEMTKIERRSPDNVLY